MVIKFDHISYSAPSCEEAQVRESFAAYQLVFEERELDNLDIKAGYLGKWQDKHNILMLGAEGLYPIELTMYEACEGHNDSYSLNAEEIVFRTNDVDESKRFFEVLDFAWEDERLSLKPMLDAKIVRLKLEQAKAEGESAGRVLLDKTGFGSIALVVDSIERYASKLNEAGYIITETKSLLVNGKTLKIAFASGKCNEIVELIGVR